MNTFFLHLLLVMLVSETVFSDENRAEAERIEQKLSKLLSSYLQKKSAPQLNCYGNYCYRFYNDAATFSDAGFDCHSEGGYLAEPRNVNQTRFIVMMVKSQYQPDGKTPWWIGGGFYDEKRDGSGYWTWYTLRYEPMETSNLDLKNTKVQGCLQIQIDKGTWVGVSCEEKRPYICQYKNEENT